MLNVKTTEKDNLIYITGSGKITGDDYESVLIPLVESKLKQFPQVRLLYHLGDDCEGFEAEALWDDAKVGLMHLTQWQKIALVSNLNWIVKATKVFGFLMPCPVKVFANEQLSEAEQWIRED